MLFANASPGCLYVDPLCEVLLALKTSSYLFLALHLTSFASHEYEDIFIFEDLLLASSCGELSAVTSQ